MKKFGFKKGLLGNLAAVCLAMVMTTGCSRAGNPELLVPSQSTEDIGSQIKDIAELPPEISGTESGSLWGFSHALLSENLTETNPVLSPVSAYLALGMSGLGAAGETRTEFVHVMGTDMHEVSARLMQNLPVAPVEGNEEQQASKLHINLANSIWVDTSMEPTESWLREVNDLYQSEVYRAELSGSDTMKKINTWIKEETFNLIPKFLEEPFSNDTRMALLNTIYFYGEWQHKFEESDTYTEQFTKEDGTMAEVEMMHDYQCYRQYISGDTYDGVLLPYRNGDIAFIALKPTEDQSVRELYQVLSEGEVEKLLSEAESTYMNLKLPKFEVTFDMILNDSLQNMGIKRAFDAGLADFSAMGGCTDGNGLHISMVRQKAVLKLNEEGTEAAAVTMVVKLESAAIESTMQPKEVFFDRPFVYMIADLKETVPLFIGIMDAPEVCQ